MRCDGVLPMCRSMRDLVDGPCYEAWARVAADLLPVEDLPGVGSSGGDWQAAIRSA